MLCLAVLGLSLFATDAPRTFTLEAGTSVWDVFSLDVNQDGNADIFGVCCDEKSDPLQKYLAGFIADAKGGYPKAPTLKLPLDPAASVVFTAELDGTPPREICAASAEGMTAYAFKDGALREVFKTEFVSLFPSGARQPSFIKDAAQDVNGDGLDEWFIPVPTGFEIRNAKGPVARIRCDVDSNIRTGSGMALTCKVPAYYSFPNGDGKDKAIAFLSDEYADFAFGQEWKQHDRFKIPVNLGDKWDTSADMKDINGDGLPDLIVTQTEGTVNLKALTQIYIAQGPMKYPDAPTAKFESAGALAAPIMKDVDGDKKLDIIFVNIPFGVKSIVNFFMWHKLGVDLDIYIFNGKGFGTTPDFSTSVTIEAPEGKEQSAYCMGDFTGDGKTDAAFGAGRDKLMLHAGGDAKFISPKPYLTLTVPSFGVARAVKLNNNSAEDIILFHPGIARKEMIEVLVF